MDFTYNQKPWLKYNGQESLREAGISMSIPITRNAEAAQKGFVVWLASVLCIRYDTMQFVLKPRFRVDRVPPGEGWRYGWTSTNQLNINFAELVIDQEIVATVKMDYPLMTFMAFQDYCLADLMDADWWELAKKHRELRETAIQRVPESYRSATTYQSRHLEPYGPDSGVAQSDYWHRELVARYRSRPQT